jgi:hypothetical protein
MWAKEGAPLNENKCSCHQKNSLIFAWATLPLSLGLKNVAILKAKDPYLSMYPSYCGLTSEFQNAPHSFPYSTITGFADIQLMWFDLCYDDQKNNLMLQHSVVLLFSIFLYLSTIPRINKWLDIHTYIYMYILLDHRVFTNVVIKSHEFMVICFWITSHHHTLLSSAPRQGWI